MFVFVEGVDGSGKSTLVKELSDSYSTIISKYKTNKIFFCQEAAKSNEIYVCDRSIISDMVYRIFDGTKPYCSINEMINIVKGSKIIYCKTEHSHENAMKRGEDNITTKEDSDKISLIYDTVMALFEIYGVAKYYLYNYEKDNVENVIKFIEKEI